MKKSFVLYVLLAIMLSSCVAKKKFLAELASKEQAQAAVAKLTRQNNDQKKQISSLNEAVSQLQKDTARLGANYRRLKTDLEAWQKQYKELQESSKMTTNELRTNLQKQQATLAEKERLLAEREAAVQELKAAIARKDEAMNGLLNKVNEALVAFNPDELTVTQKDGKIYVSLAENLLFNSGRTDVDKKGKEALGKLAEVLKKNIDIDIQVEGHTDNVPIKTATFKDNWDLSVLRATSITRILTEDYQVDPKRVMPSGKGEYYPADTNDTKEGRAKNRRIEVVLMPKLTEIMKLLEQSK